MKSMRGHTITVKQAAKIAEAKLGNFETPFGPRDGFSVLADLIADHGLLLVRYNNKFREWFRPNYETIQDKQYKGKIIDTENADAENWRNKSVAEYLKLQVSGRINRKHFGLLLKRYDRLDPYLLNKKSRKTVHSIASKLNQTEDWGLD